MAFKMYALHTNPIARFFARISRHCTVILSTGKELKFYKGFRFCSCSYEGSMTKKEEREYIRAMILIGT